MSGFSKEKTGGGFKFANFKKGKIISNHEEFESLTGRIVDVDVREEEFNKQPYDKIVLFIAHDEGITQLGFDMKSGYGTAFVSMLPNIDLRKEVMISGSTEEKDGKNYSRMFIAQPDEKGEMKHLKWYYSAKGDKRLPEGEPILHKGKDTGKKDFSERTKFLYKMIAAWHNKVENATSPKQKEAVKASKAQKPTEAEDITEPSDDLPF